MLGIFAFLLTAPVIGSDVPVYCRSVQSALGLVKWQPLLEDLRVSLSHDVPVLGPVNISLKGLDFGDLSVVNCTGTAADSELTIDVSKLNVDIRSFQFAIDQQRWPHLSESGNVTGTMAASFAISLNVTEARENVVDFEVSALDLHVDAMTDKWLVDALVWFADRLKPVVSFTVQHVLRNVVSEALGRVRAEGSCTAANDLLQQSDMIDIKVDPVIPATVHVPLIGDVEMRATVTHVVPPRRVSCGPWAFNGTFLDMHFASMIFQADFQWEYRAVADGAWGHFWHNAGFGSANASLGCDAQVDFLHPTDADIRLHLPDLDLKLHADADDWMYRALNAVFRPILRRGLEAFGGTLIKREIECLADASLCRRIFQSGHTAVTSAAQVFRADSSAAAAATPRAASLAVFV